MNLSGWATKLLSIVLVQDCDPCCVLSGPIVSHIILFLSLSLPSEWRGYFPASLLYFKLRNWEGQHILLGVVKEVLCPWNMGFRRPNLGVRKSLSVVLCCGSPDGMRLLEAWVLCQGFWLMSGRFCPADRVLSDPLSQMLTLQYSVMWRYYSCCQYYGRLLC